MLHALGRGLSSPVYKDRCCNYIVVASCIGVYSLSGNHVKDRLEVPIVLALLSRVLALLREGEQCV